MYPYSIGYSHNYLVIKVYQRTLDVVSLKSQPSFKTRDNIIV